MAESSSSEADYKPCFQAAGQTAFIEENNFFYYNYDQQYPTTSPPEMSTLALPQPSFTDYAYDYSNFYPPDAYSPPGYPLPYFPSQDSASNSPVSSQCLKTQSTRKRKIVKEKAAAPKKKNSKEKNNTVVKKEDTEDDSTRMKEETENEGEERSTEGEQPPKRKRKKKVIPPREGLVEWDFKHRKEHQFCPKGSILVKCEDADSEKYGEVIWVVENRQLINKYVMERDDPLLGRIFIKTERYAGWMSDEPWSYFLLDGTKLDKAGERIGVTLFPMEDTIRDFCIMEKLRNPFYEELMQRLKEQDQEQVAVTVKTEVPYELEEGEIVSDAEIQVKEEPRDEEEEDLEDFKEIDKTQLFFYNNN